MTNFQCHYESLKVTPDAPPEVIRAAYRSLSQKHHPDKNHGNPEAARIMARLNLAYSVLSDAVQRELYDLQLQSQRAYRYAFHESAADHGEHATETPDEPTGQRRRSLFDVLSRLALGWNGRLAAIVLGALALVFVVACWAIWDEQRSMQLLQQAAVAARGTADAPDAGHVVAARKSPDTAAPSAAPTADVDTPAAAPKAADVPAAVVKSSEYERLTALLKSMGLGLHKLDGPAPAPVPASAPVSRRPAAPVASAEPAKAASVGATSAAVAAAPVQPARAREEAPAAADAPRGDARTAVDVTRAPAPAVSATSNTSASADAAAPRQPVIIDPRACAPAYPAKAHSLGESGTVRLALLVGGDGNVVESKIRKSSGSTELDRAARKSLSQCKFQVAGSDRLAEPVWTVVEYVFSLE